VGGVGWRLEFKPILFQLVFAVSRRTRWPDAPDFDGLFLPVFESAKEYGRRQQSFKPNTTLTRPIPGGPIGRMWMTTRALLGAILFASLSVPIFAQWNPEVPGVADAVESRVLGESRAIHVVLPEKYSPDSGARYDVLYVLDAEDDGKRILEIVRALQDRQGFIPPLIVVNVWTMLKWDRDKDLTPNRVADVPTSGGGAAFLSFMRDELIPHVDRKYATSGDNIFYGHSYGGLFGMYAFLSDPKLFKAYVLTDPALWWNHEYIATHAREQFTRKSFAGSTLWIGSRDGADHKRMGVTTMNAVLKSAAPRDLHWRSESYADETHFSVLHKSAYDGLKFAYSGFPGNRSLEFLPTVGIVAKGLAFPFVVDSRLPRDPAMRFTTDGAAPTSLSRKLQAANMMVVETDIPRVTLKSFGFRKRHDISTVVDFKSGVAWRARPKPVRAIAGGLRYAYYEGAWERLPDFTALQPARTGVADGKFELSAFPRAKDFGVVLEGFLDVPVTGHYVLVLNSDDGSKLSLDEHPLIDNDGMHGAWSPKDFMVPLERGFHSIRIEYFQRGGGAQLTLSCVAPGGTEPVPISLAYLYRSPAPRLP
jgi:predicted alpha/beta superfamily hydrolase